MAAQSGLDGRYVRNSGANYIREDGFMMIQPGDQGWNFCAAADLSASYSCYEGNSPDSLTNGTNTYAYDLAVEDWQSTASVTIVNGTIISRSSDAPPDEWRV